MAENKTTKTGDQGKLHIVTFRVGSSLLGVRIELVKEIHKTLDVTRVPGAPDIFLGMVNLRGKIVTVIDMNEALGQPDEATSENPKLLILKTTSELLGVKGGDRVAVELGYENEDSVGLYIDNIEETIVVENDMIRSTPSNLDEQKRALITGVIKQGDELILLLNVTRVLTRCRTNTMEED
jgi:purine-binding chemotaxis protein CheW